MVDAYEVYILYLALQRHFTSKGYNFNKYNGKVNASKNAFLKRRDKGLFNRIRFKLQNGNDLKDFFISNFVYKDPFSIYNIINENCFQIYKDWKKRNDNLTDYYYKDLRFLSRINIKEQLISDAGELPLVIQYYIQDKICIETLVLLDIFFKFLDRNKLLHDDEQFNEISLKIKKYKSFMNLELNKLEKITLNTIIK